MTDDHSPIEKADQRLPRAPSTARAINACRAIGSAKAGFCRVRSMAACKRSAAFCSDVAFHRVSAVSTVLRREKKTGGLADATAALAGWPFASIAQRMT